MVDLAVFVISVSIGLTVHHLSAERERLTAFRHHLLAEVVAMQQIHRINDADFTERDELRHTATGQNQETD
jgi:hypothetical protein